MAAPESKTARDLNGVWFMVCIHCSIKDLNGLLFPSALGVSLLLFVVVAVDVDDVSVSLSLFLYLFLYLSVD